MIILTILLSAIACAAAFRLRGDAVWDKWTGTGTTGGRALWAAVVGLCLFASGANWWTAPATVLVFACAIPGWPACIDLGRNEGTWLKDFALMTVRGALFTMPAGLLLGLVVDPAYAVFALSGAMAGVAYEAGHRIGVRWPFLAQGPALGEFIFGAVVGLSIAGV